MKKYISDLYHKVKQKDSLWILCLFIISFYVRFDYFFKIYFSEKGLPKTQDSFWYMDHANELIENFKIEHDFNGILYLGYYVVLAFILWIFKTEIVMVILQVFLNAFGVILCYRICEMVFNRRVALIAGILYIFSYELKFWSLYLLTDSLFTFFILLVIYIWLKRETSGNNRFLAVFIISLTYLAFIRPAGVITIAFFFIFLMTKIDYYSMFKNLTRKPVLWVCAILLSFLLLGSGIYFLLESNLLMSIYWSLRWLLYGNYASGQVFDIPTPYDHIFQADKRINYFNNFVVSFFLNNGVHIFIIYIKRFMSFWGELWIWQYHFAGIKAAVHYLIRLAPLVLIAVGVLRAAAGKAADKALILFIPVISSLLFCIVFFIDAGWRYKLPSIPFNIMFLAYGVDAGICLAYKWMNRVSKGFFLYP